MKPLRPVPASLEILEKIEQKHGIRFHEVEGMFQRDPLVLRGAVDQYGERRYTALGDTPSGRFVLVVFTIPERHLAKVITARDMVPREKRYYTKLHRQRRGK